MYRTQKNGFNSNTHKTFYEIFVSSTQSKNSNIKLALINAIKKSACVSEFNPPDEMTVSFQWLTTAISVQIETSFMLRQYEHLVEDYYTNLLTVEYDKPIYVDDKFFNERATIKLSIFLRFILLADSDDEGQEVLTDIVNALIEKFSIQCFSTNASSILLNDPHPNLGLFTPSYFEQENI